MKDRELSPFAFAAVSPIIDSLDISRYYYSFTGSWLVGKYISLKVINHLRRMMKLET